MNDQDLRTQLEALHPASYGWALACCKRDAEEASEVLQLAYLRILGGQAHFGGRSALRTWIFGVIRMTARERRTQQARQQRREVNTARTAVEPVVEDQRVADLLDALTRLSAKQREVLHLVFYHDMTIEEAARVMNIGLGTARTHYQRGKQRLRQLLSAGQEVTR